MAIQTINIGTVANDGNGDPLRTAFNKANSNFSELDTRATTAQNTADGAQQAADDAQAGADASVKSVNGVDPATDGSLTLEPIDIGASSQEDFEALAAIVGFSVFSVNGIAPDTSGNVALELADIFPVATGDEGGFVRVDHYGNYQNTLPEEALATEENAGFMSAAQVVALAAQAAILAAGLSHRNKIHNGNFSVNQRVVSGTVSLGAGAYGHDRWKAGASGCTYTFATSGNVTTLTITAGSLQQVIPGASLFTGDHVLSWAGTAQGKIGAGSYAASGVTGAATGGTNLTVEFGTGTLSKVQLEAGTIPTPFELKDELPQCLRYYQKSYAPATAPGTDTATGLLALTSRASASHTVYLASVRLPVPMAGNPTVTVYPRDGAPSGSIQYNASGGGSNEAVATVGGLISPCDFSVSLSGTAAGLTAGDAVSLVLHYTAAVDL